MLEFFSVFFEVKKSEWKRVFGAFTYFFLTIAAYYVLKTVRNAYFVERLGADVIPWVNIAIAFSTIFLIAIYSRIANKTLLKNLINGSILFLVSNIIAFWFLFPIQVAWLPFIFFMWVTFFSAVSVTQFWTFINDIFDSREAKRVYGLVGAGGIIGGMMGSYIASHFSKIVGTRDLLLIAGGIMLLCVFIVQYLSTDKGYQEISSPEVKYSKEDEVSSKEGPLKLIMQSKYLFNLMILVGLIKFASNLTEWQFNKIAELNISGMDNFTHFFGKISFYLNFGALIIQIFLTPFFLRTFGLAATLFILPSGLLFSSVFLFAMPGVWSGSFLKIVDGSFRYSINQSAKEFVYLPIRRVVRYKIKPFVDMFVYQFSKGLASLFILAINSFIFVWLSSKYPDINEETKVLLVSGVVFLSLLYWLYIVYQIKKEHPAALKDYLDSEIGNAKKVPKIDADVFSKKLIEFCSSNDLSFLEIENFNDQGVLRGMNLVLDCREKFENNQVASELTKLLLSESIDQINYSQKLELANKSSHEILAEYEGCYMLSRYLLTRKLTCAKINHEKVTLHQSDVMKLLSFEMDSYFHLLSLYSISNEYLESLSDDVSPIAYKQLVSFFYEASFLTVHRIFDLISLLIDTEDLAVIEESYLYGNMNARALSLELLEFYLGKRLKRKILKVLDGPYALDNIRENPNRIWQHYGNTVSDALEVLLKKKDPVLVLSVLLFLSESKVDVSLEVLKEIFPTLKNNNLKAGFSLLINIHKAE